MRYWLYLLGGLIVWSLHFLGVYVLVSLAAQTSADDTILWRILSLVFSVACGLAAAALALFAVRRARGAAVPSFEDMAAGTGGLLGGIGIIWQAWAPMVAGA